MMVMTVRCHRMRKCIIRLLQWEVGVGDVELGVARHTYYVGGTGVTGHTARFFAVYVDVSLLCQLCTI